EVPRLARCEQSHPRTQFKRIGYSYRILVRRLERSADRWYLLHSSSSTDGRRYWMAIRPPGQAPRDRRHTVWNQASRYRGRSSCPLEPWPNRGKDNVSWTRGGAWARAMCSRFASTGIASAGRWSSLRARSKNIASVLLGGSRSHAWKRNLSDHGIVQPSFAFSSFLEARRNRIRQRLCALSLPSS